MTTPEGRAAYVNAQAAAALIRCAGMQATNATRLATGKPPAYDEWDFQALIDDHGLGANAVIGLLNG